MHLWVDELNGMASLVLGTAILWIMGAMLVTGALLFVLVFNKLADYMAFPLQGTMRSWVVLLLTVALPAGSTIAARIHLTPRFGLWSVWAGLGIGMLAATLVPMSLGRTKYGRGLLAWILSIAAAAGIMVLTRAALDAFSAGDRSIDRWRDRQEETGRSMAP